MMTCSLDLWYYRCICICLIDSVTLSKPKSIPVPGTNIYGINEENFNFNRSERHIKEISTDSTTKWKSFKWYFFILNKFNTLYRFPSLDQRMSRFKHDFDCQIQNPTTKRDSKNSGCNL